MPAEPKVIVVEQHEFRVTTYPHTLSSGGLGPCIAIGVVYGKRAYMFHTPLIQAEKATKDFFARLRKDIPRKARSTADVILCGGELGEADEVDPDGPDEIRFARHYALEKLRKDGFIPQHIEWCPNGCMHTLDIDLSNRIASIETERFGHDGLESERATRIQLKPAI